MADKSFVLFSDCIPVKGANRSVICDTRNNKYHIIPNGLYDILEKFNGSSLTFVKKEFENKFDDILDEYFDFLQSNNLVFYCSDPTLFPKVDLQWHTSSLITNAIIDYNEIQHDFKSIVRQLEILKCSYIQLRFFRKTKLDFIEKLVKMLNDEKSRIVSLDIIVPFNARFSKEKLIALIKNSPRIHAIILFNSPKVKSYEAIWEKMGYLMYVKRNILDEKHCGIINTEYFYSNIKLFSESQHYNTCLNHKISIDQYGNIKNCPSMAQSFGNIIDTSLLKALSEKDFKKYWNISKDQIAVCRDCEFRHVCTDCRAYLENPEDKFSKPLKCGYNPYTNEWTDWSVNPLKQKAINQYEMQELIKEK